MTLYSLDSRAVIRVHGEDAKKLLNDTLTCRFVDLGAGTGRWFALLNPQGKILAEGLATFEDDAFWLDLERDSVADFLKRMRMYKLRAKVEFEPLEDAAVLWSPDGDVPAAGTLVSYRDERGSGIGSRHIVRQSDMPHGIEESHERYAAARIAAGVSEMGKDFATNDIFPHDIGMDFGGGVDFAKGCYVGQEVVSRMQHRGTARRRPALVSGLPNGAAAGAPLLVGEREVGTIGTAVEGAAVAVVRLDRITDPAAVTFAGLPVVVTLPAWATYRFGESPVAE